MVDDFEYCLVLLWKLWNERYNILFGRNYSFNPYLVEWVGSYFSEFKTVTKCEIGHKVDVVKWQAPRSGEYNIRLTQML